MKRAIEDSFPIVEINRLAVPERNAFKPIYQMHKWFARRASCVFRAILLGALKPLPTDEKGNPTKSGAQVIMDEFYKDHTHDPDTKGKVILDPFMGGGTTVVEALRLGCKVIGIDLNPVAWFIVKTEVEPVDIDELKAAFERLANQHVEWSGKSVRETLLEQYKTECPCCGNKDADIIYTFWVKAAICHNRLCPARSGDQGAEVPLFSDYILTYRKPSIRYWPDVSCPKCDKTFDWEIEPAALVADAKLMQEDARTSAGEGRGNVRWAYGPGKSVCCPWCKEDVKPLPKSTRLTKTGPRPERKKVPLTVLLCPHCESVSQWRGELPAQVSCPACAKIYDPVTGNLPVKTSPSGVVTTDNNDFICPSCGQRQGILDSLRQLQPEERRRLMPYGIEGYCASCADGSELVAADGLFSSPGQPPGRPQGKKHLCWLTKSDGKFFKATSASDLSLYQNAVETWKRESADLPYPKQKIPFGYQTVKGNDLPGHGYAFWHQLFNPRQLLCLSTLMKAMDEEKDEVLKDMLLSGFMQLIRNQCLLCFYNVQAGKLEPGLSRKDFAPPKLPCENSVWGSEYGRGTFVSIIKKIIKGKAFCWDPKDRRFVNVGSNGDTELVDVPSNEKILGTIKNVQLEAKSSAHLHSMGFDDVAFVITDPPYADNVNYAEVSEFFYVWLRLILASRYRHFMPEEVPKVEEIIAQEVRGRSMSDFQEGLTDVFAKAGRKLNPDGLLIFTFHHEANTAWEAVLDSVMKAGFIVEAAFPYESDAPKGGSMGAQKIAYDIIHVCRRRSSAIDETSRSWAGVRQQIRDRARAEIRAIESGRYGNEPLSPTDVNIVLIGKCLELYSKHYSKIVDHEGNPMPLHAALEEIRMLVDQLTRAEQELPTELENVDPPSYVYLTSLSGRGEVKSDEVHKATRGILEPDELLDAGLIIKGRAKRGRTYEVKQPIERLPVLRKKFGASLTRPQAELFGEDLSEPIRPGVLFIDYVHFLLGLVTTGESVVEWLETFRGRRPEIRAALEYMANKNKAFAEPVQRIIGLMDERTLFTKKD